MLGGKAEEIVLEWYQLIGFCVLAAVLVITFRQISAVWAGGICAVFGLMLLGAMMPQIQAYIEGVIGFFQTVGLESEYYMVMLRTMGIVLVTQVSAQVCRDMEAETVACRVEMCGRLALLGIAVPVFIELTQLSVSVLGV